jgi:hypothetical protein
MRLNNFSQRALILYKRDDKDVWLPIPLLPFPPTDSPPCPLAVCFCGSQKQVDYEKAQDSGEIDVWRRTQLETKPEKSEDLRCPFSKKATVREAVADPRRLSSIDRPSLLEPGVRNLTELEQGVGKGRGGERCLNFSNQPLFRLEPVG